MNCARNKLSIFNLLHDRFFLFATVKKALRVLIYGNHNNGLPLDVAWKLHLDGQRQK